MAYRLPVLSGDDADPNLIHRLAMRRSSFIAALLLLLGLAATARAGEPRASALDSTEANGIDVGLLDSTYASGFAMFGDDGGKYPEAWEGMLRAIGKTLAERKFAWSGPSQMFVRVYFDRTGAIDYLLFDAPDPADDRALAPVLAAFAQSYRFPLAATVPYVQCGSASFVSR